MRKFLPGNSCPINESFMRTAPLCDRGFIGVRMIKVTRTGSAGNTRPARGSGASRAAAGGFRIDDAAGASSSSGAAPASEAASASALGALIALQSEGRGGARNRATAERILMLLERLRDGLLAGRIAVSDLSALAIAADAKLNDPDEAIASLHAEIALRARVELAKLGHS